MYGCGILTLEQAAQKSKSPKGHSIAAVAELPTLFAAGQG